MKKVIVYTVSNGDPAWKHSLNFDGVAQYLNKQIDSSMKFGWEDDLKIITNFDYEYKGIKVINLDIFEGVEGTCVSKYHGLLWALKEYQDIVWFNDHDNFQIDYLETDPIEKIMKDYYVYGCGKPHKGRWSDLSMFFQPGAIGTIESFLSINRNMKKTKGVTFKMCKHFLKCIPEKVKLISNDECNFRFNTVGNWSKTLRRMNGLMPICVHGKLDNDKFVKALEVLGKTI